MNKEEQIKKRLSDPVKVGDYVDVNITYTASETVSVGKGKNKTFESKKVERKKTGSGTVSEIIKDKTHGTIYVLTSSSSWSVPYEAEIKLGKNYPYGTNIVKENWITPSTSHCGADPFKKNIPRITFVAQDVYALLAKAGYGKRTEDFNAPVYDTIKGIADEDKPYTGCTHGGVNFDPFVTDKEGNRQYYQRGYVWNLEQKQLLISSIYNGIEIGKFIFRYHSWENIRIQMKETGHGYDFDMVDGKQRMNALIEFVGNKFQDSFGNYFKDLSEDAQRHFLGYNKLTIGEMDERTKDETVISAFLTLNFTGVPMSKEHINFVQSIKI